jgi:hypothetical protein
VEALERPPAPVHLQNFWYSSLRPVEFASYVGLMTVEGWSIGEVLGRRNCTPPRHGNPFHRPPPFPQYGGLARVNRRCAENPAPPAYGELGLWRRD